MVTAGVCGPPIGPATVMPAKNAHPAVITIHPLPFTFFRTTFATTRYLVKQGALNSLFLLQMVSYFCFRDKIILQPSFQRAQQLYSSFQ
jgi:hypothetical protein